MEESDVELILTVPNVYSLPHAEAIREFVHDHTNLRRVHIVHESDAIAYYASGLAGALRRTVEELYQFGNSAERELFARLIRTAFQTDPQAGVYVVTVDIGRGSADLSLVHLAWLESQHQYHVLARTGSNKAGNHLSYILAQYYSAQLRAAYQLAGLTESAQLAPHLWDFCTLSEYLRALDPQQGLALDLLLKLIDLVKQAVDENYCIDGRLCSLEAQWRLASEIADCVVTYLGQVTGAQAELLGAPDSSERMALRDALAEALLLPVGRPLGRGDPTKFAGAGASWAAGVLPRGAARGGSRAARRGGGRPLRPVVLDLAAWQRLGEELRDLAEDSPYALLRDLDKSARSSAHSAAGEAEGAILATSGMTRDNTLVVLAGQASQFRPLQAKLRLACQEVFGCPEDHILALSGREAKEACCWGALSFVLQRPLHIGAAALHGTYGFLDTGPEGFVPVNMAALNAGRSCTVTFRYPGFRHLVYTPRAVETIEELGRDYTPILGFAEQIFEVVRTPEGLLVNGREVRLPVEGQPATDEDLLAKLWPEQMGSSANVSRKRALPPAPSTSRPGRRARPGRLFGRHLSLLLAFMVLGYPAYSLITRQSASGVTAALQPPPPHLLQSLQEGPEDYTKGSDEEAEEELARAVLSLPLHQRLLRVEVAATTNRRMALIKLQAGDLATGLFRVPDLQEDALNCLQAAFASPLQLQHVDLWSVVPGEDATGPVHRPVFSVAVDRDEFVRATRVSRPADPVLDGLGLVRFAPEFLRYAGALPGSHTARSLPRNAWCDTPVRDNWERLREQCASDRRLRKVSKARVVVHIPVTDNSVGLTIDDGPHPLITPLFLDILARHKVRATFFMVGEKAEEFPELLRRTVDEGHEIGNHTYDHPRLGDLPAAEALAQIRGGAQALGELSGRSPQLLRPPGGGVAEDVLRAAAAADATVVLWTHNTNDWLRPSPEEIAANALRDLTPGAIILMHQGSLESVAALPLIIEGAEAMGLRLRPVGEMLRHCPPRPMPVAEIMDKYQHHLLGEE